jgi:hypothetical protein
VDDDDRVLARLDHLVEIADGAVAHGGGQRAVVPDGLIAFEQEAADEVCGRQVFVAGDRDERAAQTPRHVLDEARLAAARRAFEHDRQTRGVRRLEQLHLAPDREVERLLPDDVLLDPPLSHASPV